MAKVTTPELPPPDEAKQGGWKEVARIWRREDDEGEQCSASIRTISSDPGDWTFVLATLARSAARPFILASKLPRRVRDTAVETLAYKIVRGAAADDFEEIDEIITEAEDMMAGVTSHPGELGVPDVALARPDAIEAISVWIAPDVECPGCGETHEGGAFAGVSTNPEFKAEDFGRALGAAARTCASMIVETRGGDFDSVLMAIQTAMMQEPVEEEYQMQGAPHPGHRH